MDPKPVERRYLWSPASLAPMGKLEMWLEMPTPPEALKNKPKVLNAPLRLVGSAPLAGKAEPA